MASLSASAIDVIGAELIQLLDAGIESLGVEVIQLVGASQMTFCVFFGSADIEKEAGGICLCLVDECLWVVHPMRAVNVSSITAIRFFLSLLAIIVLLFCLFMP